MGNTFYFGWEVALMEWLQAMMGPFLVKLASFFSTLGEQYVLVLVLGFVYWCWDKQIGKRIGLNIIMGVTWNPIFKNIALRRRPYFDNPTIKCLKPVEADADIYDIAAQGYSFPSGHSTNSVIAYGSIAYFFKNKLLRVICIILPLLVGISRFCVGVHYPTDVLFGWALGALIVFGMPWLQGRFKSKKVFYAVIFCVSLVGCFWCRTDDYYTGLGMMAGFFIGDLFEEKYTRFESTRQPLECIVRLLIGGGVFLALNVGLKLPFPKELLASATPLSFFIRTARYAVTLFIEIGVLPMLFKYIKFGKKKA